MGRGCGKDLVDLHFPYAMHTNEEPLSPPHYCFSEFENARDAKDAIRSCEEYDINGHRPWVDLAHGGRGALSVDHYIHFSSGGDIHNGRLQRHCDD